MYFVVLLVHDGRPAVRRPRPDVLVYQTDALEEDVTIAGPIAAELHVSTTGTDSDWVVKLIDVYPGRLSRPEPNPAGVQDGRLPAAGPRRRDARQVPQQLREAGAVRRRASRRACKFDAARRRTTRSAAATGSWCRCRARWFPLVDRNPQTFVDIYTAKETDFQKATQRVPREMVAR